MQVFLLLPDANYKKLAQQIYILSQCIIIVVFFS